ncbi:DUF4254 domain-containing protein [Desulfovibrio ferrophilus]|uniref:DUF4254 domain-containing protein n=1 Tax=Desulfovibrio ferrophilus TaxID=241368 RepID=A0A2Z6AXC8_9BACT|nr:DUF4254 domain-containing protein [Desulfovibrio ferrophilus]BBD07899.1 uncharacterized protein DFE_1173 [Desulfovibrio ferrophilus]
MTTTLADIQQAVSHIIEEQGLQVDSWHQGDPGELPEPAPAGDLQVMIAMAAREHQANYQLWHVEDEARRVDVGPEIIADCKRRIDGLNQRRNDLIEKVDACLVPLVSPLIPAEAPERYNTETVGTALDRLSIIALKIFHMREQTERDDVDQEHLDSCRSKLAVLEEQRDDLARSVSELLEEYAAGTKRPKVYYQFKMYNDPKLNPSLYANK